MTKEPTPQEILQEFCKRDPRYPFEAYDFVYQALGYVQQQMTLQGQNKDGSRHVSGQQLSEGCRDFALQEYGLMAGIVLKSWNIHATADFGELVYNLISIQMMTRNDTDRKEDFHNVYDLDKAFAEGFRFQLEG